MCYMIRKLFVCSLLMLLLIPTIVQSAQLQPRWTLEMNAGMFEPEADNWSSYYGSKRMYAVGGSVAYRLLYVLDLGMSVDYAQDRGTGSLPISGIQSGKVTYRILPVDLYALLRLRFTEGQWLVPYAGGGYTRFAYHISTSGQDATRGSVNGYHARAGLQLLLDPLDKGSAKEMLRSYGAINSYLYFEVKRSRAEANSAIQGDPAIQLGGYSFKSGLMVEFR